MPKMNGFEVIRRVRRLQPKQPHHSNNGERGVWATPETLRGSRSRAREAIRLGPAHEHGGGARKTIRKLACFLNGAPGSLRQRIS
jgi:hypothetical protein